MFWATYLEATCPGSPRLCSTEGGGPDLPSDSSGWCKGPNWKLWGASSESLSLAFFGGFSGRTPPSLETKEDKGVGDDQSTFCHGWQPNLAGPQLRCEQVCSTGRKPLLWHLSGDREMGGNLIQKGPRSLHGHMIQRLFTHGPVMTEAESWGGLAWLQTTEDNWTQLTFSGQVVRGVYWLLWVLAQTSP